MTKVRRRATKKSLAFLMSLSMVAPMAVPAIPAFATTAAEDVPDVIAGKGYSLVWNDEFEGTTLNTDDWNVELHEPGWVNAELQTYTKLDEGNIVVKDGVLSILPKAEKKEGDAGSAQAVSDVFEGKGFEGWGGSATSEIKDGAATVVVSNVGENAWDVQFQKAGLTLIEGHDYKLTMKVSAAESRDIQLNITDLRDYSPYKNEIFTVGPEEKECSIEFTMGECEAEKVAAQINLGNFGEGKSAATTLEFSDVELIDLTVTSSSSGKTILDAFDSSWDGYGFDSKSVVDGTATIVVSDAKANPWDVQFQKAGMTLVEGHDYVLSMKAKSNVVKKIQLNATNTTNYAAVKNEIVTVGTEETVCELKFTMTDVPAEKLALQVNLGKMDAEDADSATVELYDLSLVDLSDTGSVDVKKAYNYTSGRVNTQGKEDFIYGYFEARARVPEGQGYLPAFWLMASDEDNYGQWPKCGEVDIMEVMGQDTTTSHHTIHYGYDANTGHRSEQHSVTIPEGEKDYYEDYHTFGLEWEPGKLTWYVDGKVVGTSNKWFTGKDETSKLTYPAPFDQEFYVILNLAVGGSWVGYPDQAAVDDMPNQSYDIDYVRVYQKDPDVYAKEEAACVEPEETSTRREPDAFGNYVVNGDFANQLVEDSSAEDGWELHLEPDNKESIALIGDNEIWIGQAVEGTVDYSCQLKQANVPMVKGYEYELSFDAYADEAREMLVCIEGDTDNNWARYFGDQKVTLSTEKESFSYKFTMEEKTDETCCLEFALGNQKSTAGVYISNVKLVQTGGEEIVDVFQKEVAADGNYILNGSFDQGEGRLGYWELEDNDKKRVSVTNVLVGDERVRQAMVEIKVPKVRSTPVPVILSQTELAPIAKGTYEFSFDAYTTDGSTDGMYVVLGGETFEPKLTERNQTFTFTFKNKENLTRENSNIFFIVTKPGTYYLDNVAVRETAMIKNGSFNSGLAGYEYGAYQPGDATFGVDSQKAGNDTAFDADIKDVGTADWNVQLKQRGILLEKGHFYKLSYQAKATQDRTISVVMQKDGSKDDIWAVYTDDNKNSLTSKWQNFDLFFEMKDDTDDDALLSVSLGYFDGDVIDGVHHVYLDNFVLVETDENGNPLDDAEEPQAEWKKVDGKWYYFDEDGEIEKNAYRDGYALNKSGVRTGKKVPGWKKDSKGWYYDLGSGKYLKNTWKMIDGDWYFFAANGYMASYEWRKGYWLNKDGTQTYDGVASWYQDKLEWAYGDSNGWVASNQWEKIDGKWYYFNEAGFLATEQFIDGWWVGKNGAQTYKFKATWRKDANGWWFGDKSGWYAKGETLVIDGVEYTFGADGYVK